jgi:hypothetical protein
MGEGSTKLLEVQVVVENTFCIVKVFKILGGAFCHSQNRKGQIDENHILTICTPLIC